MSVPLFINVFIYLMKDKREVDAVAALPAHENCLFCEVLGDNFVSGPFSLKLSECFGVFPPQREV